MNALQRIFPGAPKPVIAMAHCLALPGTPNYDAEGGMGRVVEGLRKDVAHLQEAGVDGLLFCNEGDLPYATAVGPEIPAAMASVIGQLRAELSVPFGVNVLWDPIASLAVAAATGARFVREVFTGAWDSEMGLFSPDGAGALRYRRALDAQDVAVFANVTPEFSRSIAGRSVAERTKGAVYFRVDAVLISGPAAGVPVNREELVEAKQAAGVVPVLANTGVRPENVEDLLAVADGVIVGSSLKVDGNTWNPVDPARARALVAAVLRARQAG